MSGGLFLNRGSSSTREKSTVAMFGWCARKARRKRCSVTGSPRSPARWLPRPEQGRAEASRDRLRKQARPSKSLEGRPPLHRGESSPIVTPMRAAALRPPPLRLLPPDRLLRPDRHPHRDRTRRRTGTSLPVLHRHGVHSLGRRLMRRQPGERPREHLRVRNRPSEPEPRRPPSPADGL